MSWQVPASSVKLSDKNVQGNKFRFSVFRVVELCDRGKNCAHSFFRCVFWVLNRAGVLAEHHSCFHGVHEIEEACSSVELWISDLGGQDWKKRQ
eukprot:2790670-Rhodomonas_salina.1